MTSTTQPIPPGAVPRTGDRALRWWQRYCHPVDGDPAARAMLRRCRSATDAAAVRAAVALARELGALSATAQDSDSRISAALNLARVLAHVTVHDPAKPPMRAAGWESFPSDRRGGDADVKRPRLSETRFRRLLDSRPGDELVTAFTRLVALLEGRVSITVLAEDFYFWNDRTKRRWAFDYYAAGSAAPTTSTTEETEE